MHIFLMGGTGLVGTRLIKRLLDRKDQVTLLTRRPDVAKQKWSDSVTVVQGDPMQAGSWMDEVGSCDSVINLTGEGIFNKRWNAEFLQLIRDSRVKSTANAVQALSKQPTRPNGTPKVLVNASAIGFYGPHGDEELTESDGVGTDTLAGMCLEWEKAASAGESAGLRVVRVRIGVVLDKEGGALKQMRTPFKFFMGGPIAGGKQWLSWIHHEDLIGILLLGLDQPKIQGPMNGTAPQPVTNKQFAKALGSAMGRPSFMPTPGFALRITLGQVAEVVSTGQKVLPKKALDSGYVFKFPDVQSALADVVK